MPDVHATNGATPPQSQSHAETVSHSSAPWLAEGVSRATYYRHRQSNKSENQELREQINIEPELKADIPQPDNIAAQLELNKSDIPAVEQKPTAEEYEQKIIPRANEATERIKQQLAELERSAELNRRQQQQADEINRQINEAFAFWRQAGLSPEREQALRAAPAVMVQLSEHAAASAARLHPVGSVEYVEAGKRSFFDQLDRLEQQARQHAVPAENKPMPEPTPPAPQRNAAAPRQNSARFSAPVSRELPGGYRDELSDPSKVHLSAEELDIARRLNLSPAEYGREKLKMLRAKAAGEII